MKLRWRVFFVIVIFVVAARAALPYAVLRIANRTLNGMEGYRGRIDDVDLAILRGAYHIRGVEIAKQGEAGESEFISIDDLFISVDWSALLKRSLVARFVFTRPRVTILAAAPQAPRQPQRPPQAQPQLEREVQKELEGLFPFRIDRFEVVDGEVTYVDANKKPEVELTLDGIDIVAKNLTNSQKLKTARLATIEAWARVYDSGKLRMNLKVDPAARPPDFDINAQLTGLKAAELNDFLHSYGGFDAEGGTISMFIEAAANDGYVKGYAKPILKDLKIISWRDRKEGALRAFWQAVVAAASEVIENQPKEQLGARVPFEGRLKDPDIGIWSAAASVLRNAFVTALIPRLEGAVDLPPKKR